MRLNGQPSRPNAMTWCRFSSLKTFAHVDGGYPPSLSLSCSDSVGRFSAVPEWPVLSVPQGLDGRTRKMGSEAGQRFSEFRVTLGGEGTAAGQSHSKFRE